MTTITSLTCCSKYCVKFAGQTIEITVTNKASAVEKWVSDIRSIYNGKPIIVGLDTEGTPQQLYGGNSINNRTEILQLCIDNKCLILQLFYMHFIPQSFKSFLSDPSVTFVGVEVSNDIAKLSDEYGLKCSGSKDLRELALSHLPDRLSRHPGLKEIAKEILQVDMEKPKHVSTSKWESRILNEDQIKYACIDAYASYRIGNKLLIGEKSAAAAGVVGFSRCLGLICYLIKILVYCLVGMIILGIVASLINDPASL